MGSKPDSIGEYIMSGFFNMGGYAIYVWPAIGVFLLAMLVDFISLRTQEKKVKRIIKSIIRRKNNKHA